MDRNLVYYFWHNENELNRKDNGAVHADRRAFFRLVFVSNFPPFNGTRTVANRTPTPSLCVDRDWLTRQSFPFFLTNLSFLWRVFFSVFGKMPKKEVIKWACSCLKFQWICLPSSFSSYFLLKFGEQPILSHRNNFSALNLMEK